MMDEELNRTAEKLIQGYVILYPTDTIWGIGCDATNQKAVQKIYEIKRRTDSKSMLVLVSEPKMLYKYLKSVPEKALEIINTATKPTTIIYPGAIHLAPNLIGSDGSIGIRITADPFCRRLIKLTGIPIVSTSANISGRSSPASFGEIEQELFEGVDYVVGWRQDEITKAVASSIVKVNEQGETTLIRP
jgi:L-threonylcarbamoyladenylate synthase